MTGFQDYSALETSIARKLRDDTQIDEIRSFIELFEGKVKRELRVGRMESRSTATTIGGQRTLIVPDDFIATRSLFLTADTPVQLNFLPVNVINREYGTTPGVPAAYAIVGREYYFGPIPAGDYGIESNFYSFVGLSDTAPTNWLLEEYPDAYLYGALSYANHSEALAWRAVADQTLDGIRRSDRSERWNGPPFTRRVDFVAA